MRFRILCITAAAMFATGCATVDMTEMASPVAARSEAPAEKNIVLRAASKLYAAFQSKGFVGKTSKKKMQSAASILLNGLEARELTAANAYAAQGHSYSVVLEDISYATQHVIRTANAAEVYFEMSEGRRKLRKELGSLEEALLASREASNAFETVVGETSSELRVLNLEIDRLKRVTDNFGQRVRDMAAAEMAARRTRES
jgi:hypothetical protein